MAVQDAYCFELRPNSTKFDKYLDFRVILTKKSRVLEGSLIVIPFGLKQFLSSDSVGSQLRRALESAPYEEGCETGTFMLRVSKEKNKAVFENFYPFERSFNGKHFDELFRGKRFGVSLETRLYKFVKARHPGMLIEHGKIMVLNPRAEQMKKIRGGTHTGTVEEHHKSFKGFLLGHLRGHSRVRRKP